MEDQKIDPKVNENANQKVEKKNLSKSQTMSTKKSVVSVSDVCDHVDQVVPAHHVDDKEEIHEVDPVHQVDHQDEHAEDDARKNGPTFYALFSRIRPLGEDRRL